MHIGGNAAGLGQQQDAVYITALNAIVVETSLVFFLLATDHPRSIAVRHTNVLLTRLEIRIPSTNVLS
jgi:hypothetical protein